MTEFLKIEKVPVGLNKPGEYMLPIWIDLENDKFKIENLYFQTKYAAQKFRKTHVIIDDKIVEELN